METLLSFFDYITTDSFMLFLVLCYSIVIKRKLDKLLKQQKPLEQQQQQPQKDDFWKRYKEKPQYYVNKDEKK